MATQKFNAELKNIAIIGGHGFIGKNFTQYFLEKKNQSILLVGKSSRSATNLPNVKSITCDVKNTEELCAAVKDIEIVIWLASSLIPGSENSSLEHDFNLNIKPVLLFLEKSSSSKMKKFIYLSSGGTVYGDPDYKRLWQEEDDKNPISEYGLSKLMTENYIKFITRKSNFESYILRPSNVYGKYQNLNKPQGIIGFAFKSLLQKTSISLFNEGKVLRDFIYVDDLAEAVSLCMLNKPQPSVTHIYNVGSGDPISIKEIVSKIGFVASSEVRAEMKEARSFDCDFNALNIEKLTTELNWKPKTSIDEGLQIVWEWIKKREHD